MYSDSTPTPLKFHVGPAIYFLSFVITSIFYRLINTYHPTTAVDHFPPSSCRHSHMCAATPHPPPPLQDQEVAGILKALIPNETTPSPQ